jgi:hypothetical protein
MSSDSIDSFAALLRAARAQPRPQRLLFVFAAAVLPDAPTAEQRRALATGDGGALEPLSCVDKTPAELDGFQALAAEAAQFGADWQIVFAAAMDDRGSAHAEAPLQRMVAAIRAGQIGAFLPFDRSGRAVHLSPG